MTDDDKFRAVLASILGVVPDDRAAHIYDEVCAEFASRDQRRGLPFLMGLLRDILADRTPELSDAAHPSPHGQLTWAGSGGVPLNPPGTRAR